MRQPMPDQTDSLIRSIRRSLFSALLGLAAMGLWIAMNAFPGLGWAHLSQRFVTPFQFLPPVFFCALFFVSLWNVRALEGDRLREDDPNVRAVLGDELRGRNLQGAFRLAFLVVLAVQVPLALLFWHFPEPQTPAFMGAFTIVAGVMALLGSFLFFDRE